MRLKAAALALMLVGGLGLVVQPVAEAAQAQRSPVYKQPKKPRTAAQKKAQAKATKAAAAKEKARGPTVKQKQAQKKASKAAAAKAKAKPNKPRK